MDNEQDIKRKEKLRDILKREPTKSETENAKTDQALILEVLIDDVKQLKEDVKLLKRSNK